MFQSRWAPITTCSSHVELQSRHVPVTLCSSHDIFQSWCGLIAKNSGCGPIMTCLMYFMMWPNRDMSHFMMWPYRDMSHFMVWPNRDMFGSWCGPIMTCPISWRGPIATCPISWCGPVTTCSSHDVAQSRHVPVTQPNVLRYGPVTMCYDGIRSRCGKSHCSPVFVWRCGQSRCVTIWSSHSEVHYRRA